MVSGEEILSYPLVAVSIISIAIGGYTYWRSTSRMKTPYLAFMLSLAFLAVTYLFEINTSDLSTKLFWNDLEYISNTAIPALFIWLMLEYTGYEKWLNRKVLLLVLVVPVLSLLLLWTNDVHHFFYVSSQLANFGQVVDIHMTYGFGFYIYMAATYLTLLAGTVLLFHSYLNTSRLYRGQTGIILISTVAPWFATFISLVGLNPIPFTYMVIIGLLIAAFFLFWGIFWFELFDILPLAITKVIECMKEGAIVIDRKGRVAHMNPSALEMFELDQAPLGEPVKDTDLFLISMFDGLYLKQGEYKITMARGDPIRNLEIRVSQFLDPRGNQIGRLVIITDVTEELRDREALHMANLKLNLLSNITRHDILNQLVAIRGFTELMKRRVPDDMDEQRYLSLIVRAASAIEEQVMFTRDYQKMGVRAPEWQNVTNTIRKAKVTSQVGLMEVRLETGDLELFADLMLERVFFNLLQNSVLHGQKVGSIKVQYKIEGEDCLLFYEDDGIGIPEGSKEKMFIPNEGSTCGLGMFMARQILHITGIEIYESGIEGQGAQFVLCVPPGCWRLGASDEGQR